MHPQNLAILKGLVSVAWADGRVAEEEKDVIEAFLAAFEATPSEKLEVRKFAETLKTLDDIPLTDLSADDRRVLLNHAVMITFIDGEQDEKEKELLDDLCDKLRIPPSEAQAIIQSAETRAQQHLNLLKS